jgi:hypothetical protein
MTAPKNPRITINPTAFKALSVQAALESKLPGDLASEIILSYAQAAQKAINSLQTLEGEREETIEEERCGTSDDADSEAESRPERMKNIKPSRITKEHIFAGLKFMVTEWEAGREPTAEQVSNAAGVDSSPLGKVMSQLGLKSQGRIRHYPVSYRPQAEKILQEGLPK